MYYTGRLHPPQVNYGKQPRALTTMVGDARVAHSGFRSLRLAGPGPPRGVQGEVIAPRLWTFTNYTAPSCRYNASVWVMRGALPPVCSASGPGGFKFKFDPVGLRVQGGSTVWMEIPQDAGAAPAFKWV